MAEMKSGFMREEGTGALLVAGAGTEGALTNAQLRGSPVPVDTELPAAAAPTDADSNGAAPAVVARASLHDGDTNAWLRAKGARSDGSGMPAAWRPQIVSPVLRHDADSTVRQPRTAASLTDSEAGTTFGAAGTMLHNGATYERARAASREWVTLLASAARTTNATAPRVDIPGGLRGVALLLTVHAQGATGQIRPDLYTAAANTTWLGCQPTVTAAPLAGRTVTPASPVDSSGATHVLMVVHPDAREMGPVSSFARVQALQMLATATLQVGVTHTGSDPWTYSLHAKYLP